MSSVKKFASFDEMKSCESKTVKYESSLKKHKDFEKIIMAIRSVIKHQSNQPKPKR